MTRTLRYLLLFVFIGLSGSVFAQEIAGTVLDEKKEPLINATVQVYQGGILKGGNVTDYDGKYLVKPLDAGNYNVLVSFTGYDSVMITKVVVPPGGRVSQNFNMSRHSVTLGGKEGYVIREFKKKLVDQDNPGKHVMTADEIKTLPTTEIADVAALSPALYQKQRGQGLNIGGARATGTLYIIDGVQVQNIGDAANTGINMAQNAVEQLEVITSGIPAKYGDVSGGVVSITSRGVSQKLTGNIRAQHSIDGYNNNLISFSIAGPLYKKKIKGDSINKKPVFGFALSGDYYDDHNRYPAYDQQYVLKQSVKDQLNANPLRIVSDNSGSRIYNYASNYVTFNDLEQKKILPHDGVREGRINGKLDYQVTDNLRVTGGGMLDYVSTDQYRNAASQGSLLSTDGVWVKRDVTSRGYIRFTQKFGKANDTTSRHSIISNAFYSVQADYQRTGTYTEDPGFGHNLFNYEYVGKFNQSRTNLYTTASVDSISQTKATVLAGSTSTGTTFTRSNLNPTLANYTTQFYNSLVPGQLPPDIQSIQANNAMSNGDLPRATYSFNGVGLFSSPGNAINGYSVFNSDQYALDVNASFDLLAGKTKHAIEFGLYYQQRIIKSYAADASLGGTNSIWQLMRGLVSSVDNQNLRLDKQNPIFIVNNTRYTYVPGAVAGQGTYYDPSGAVAHIIPGPGDTVVYNLKNVGTSAFDKNLRKQLGVADNAVVNIDNIDPSKLSLNLFSADELLNVSGNAFVGYYGYTYAGQTQGTVNFNDFWTAKDANGNYTRPIGAFTPNYIAGYIQDRFDYKDIHFNVGVRVDRYSANTKVMKDPYSLYPEQTVGNTSGATNITNHGVHPSNIGSDYVVYVNDNTSSNPTIIGYRNGTNWYDPTGKRIEDPAVLKQYSNGRDPQPFIQQGAKKLSDSSFNPNLSFTDYSPQVTVMPRVQFSFPISDVANFYAHYDIYAQRPYPNSIGNATAFDYFKLEAASPTGVLTNANLRSQKTFDYEVGFQQKLTDHSALTMTAFYKERKDMINIVPVLYAWPHAYQTYGNRDFSTTKGSSLTYDMRATNNLRMSVSYTLQFAEGTGSSYNGGRGLLGNLIDAGLPNLRYVTALDYDCRHTIAGNIDYRYGDGEGPVVHGKNIFQNAGANLVIKTRSGEPFTRYTDALGQTVVGGVNGSRLPWHFGTDLRIDKDFALSFGKRKKDAIDGVKPKRPKYIKAILLVNNLLNTREVLGVYGFTGRAGDNGYLTSTYGKQFVPAQVSPISYTALYTIYMNDPGQYNYARTINFALEFNF
jgi:hypothetical protein